MIERPPRQTVPGGQNGKASRPGEEYVNADDLFFWMEDEPGADIPLAAIWIDIPVGCRFCC